MLVSCLFYAPLAYGSVHPLAVAVTLALAVLSFALAVAGSAQDLALPSLAKWVFPGLLGWELFSLLPLPPPLLGLLSPASAELQAYILSPLGAWPAARALSLDLPATAFAIARHASFLLLLLTTLLLATNRGRRRQLAKAAAGLGIVLVLLAFVHRLGSYSYIYAFLGEGLRLPTKAGGWLFASFVNPNHFAALLTLLAPLGLGLALSARERPRALLWGLGFAGMGLACVLTLSRGGMLGLILAIGIFVFLLWRQRYQQIPARDREAMQRRFILLRPLPLAAFGLMALVGVFVLAGSLALDPILEQFSGFAPKTFLDSEARVALWTQVASLLPHYWFTGSGSGSFEFLYPTVRAFTTPSTFVFAECQPLQALLELGWVPALGGMAALAATLFAGARHARTARSAGLCAGLIGLGIHEFADFSTAYGGVAVPAMLALGLVIRLRGAEREGSVISLRRLSLLGAAVALAGILGLGLGWGQQADETLARLQSPEHAKLPLATRLAALAEDQAHHPADHMPGLVAGRLLLDAGQPAKALAWLGRSMYLSPSDPLPHLLAGVALAAAGPKARSQSLLEFRLAAQWGATLPTLLAVVASHTPEREAVVSVLPDTVNGKLAGLNFFIRRHRYVDALAFAQALVQRWPQKPAVLQRATLAARLAKDFETALRWSQVLIAGQPAAFRGYYELGIAQRSLGHPMEEEAAYVLGLNRVPGNYSLSLALAGARLRRKDPRAALTALDHTQLPGNAKSRAQYYLMRSDALVALDLKEEALSALQRAADLAPGWAPARTRMERLLVALGREEASIAP